MKLTSLPHFSWLPFAIVIALVPLGAALNFPSVTALLSRVVDENERGLYMGVQQTYGGMARVIYPLIAGVASDHLGEAAPFWISGGLVLTTIAMGSQLGPLLESHIGVRGDGGERRGDGGSEGGGVAWP